jgi:transcriptional regulator with XRE-family HTH domain
MASAATFRDQLLALEGLLGSRRQVARLLGVNHGRISAWLGTSRPRPAAIRKIADAAAVVDALSARAGSNADAIVSSLEASWGELDGARPSTLIAAGRADEVLQVIREATPQVSAKPTFEAESELVDALMTLAAAARASADAVRSAQLGVRE